MTEKTTREAQRLQTRERVLIAAVGEFAREGMARADIKSITAAAGVAHGTFFFHFPTKEHVLLELGRREEETMAAHLAEFFAGPHTVEHSLARVVEVLEDVEKRLGAPLFRDFLSMYFSSPRPPDEEWAHHPVIVAYIDEFGAARDRGEIPKSANPFHHAVFFLLGVYALMLTVPDAHARRALLQAYLDTTLAGITAAGHA